MDHSRTLADKKLGMLGSIRKRGWQRSNSATSLRKTHGRLDDTVTQLQVD